MLDFMQFELNGKSNNRRKRRSMPNVTYSLDTLPPVDTDSLEKLALLNDEDIDFSDIPLLSSDKLQEFAPAHYSNKDMYKPIKVDIHAKVDADVLLWLKSFGKGYQTRMNAILRIAMRQSHKKTGH